MVLRQLSRDPKRLITRLRTSPNKVEPKLGLVHHSIGGDAGAIVPAPITSLGGLSCEFKPIKNVASCENYLAIYVQKL